jgi:predicted alpha/beta-fold hydrolase
MYSSSETSIGLKLFISSCILSYASLLIKSKDIPKLIYNSNNNNNNNNNNNEKSNLNEIIFKCDILHKPYQSPWINNLFDFHGHFDTCIPSIIRKLWRDNNIKHKYRRELITLPDCGTVALDWVDNKYTANIPISSKDNIIIILLHGLGGNSNSTYVSYTVKELLNQGYRNICGYVSRGCGNVPLTTPVSFTAANTRDFKYCLEHIKSDKSNKNKKFFGIGYSLGAGILLKVIAEEGEKANDYMLGAIAVSPSWNFHIKTPWFELWSKNILVRVLSRWVSKNKNSIATFSDNKLNIKELLNAKSVREFDELAIVNLKHIHGFESVDDYYTYSSAIHGCSLIDIPTLAISGMNDPVCSGHGAPNNIDNKLGKGLVIAQVLKGGHVTFPQSFLGTTSWVDEVIINWLEAIIT